MSQTPRGLRLNNPLNIRRSGSAWIGKVTPSRDPAFETFDTLEHGIRAAFIIIRTYINRYGCNTPATIIGRWAPPSENPTRAYLDFVCREALVAPRQLLSFDRPGALTRLVWAMACFECGRRLDYNDYWLTFQKYFTHD